MSGWIILLILVGVLAAVLYFLRKENQSPLGQENVENDGSRFARLLVAEIKLYENYKLERGLKNHDLYGSLKDEIKEARKKYKKRFGGKDFEVFFDEALVDVLANGDRSKMGLTFSSLN